MVSLTVVVRLGSNLMDPSFSVGEEAYGFFFYCIGKICSCFYCIMKEVFLLLLHREGTLIFSCCIGKEPVFSSG